jgi:hypothetical protein
MIIARLFLLYLFDEQRLTCLVLGAWCLWLMLAPGKVFVAGAEFVIVDDR